MEEKKTSESFENSRNQMISNFSQTTYIIPKGDVWRKHNPFVESHGIAREFSKLPINSKTNEIEHKDAIMFAKKYGLLGIGEGNEKKRENLKNGLR